MKLPWKPVYGTFIKRLNRFVGLAQINNSIVKTHIHDPGRLRELLINGAQIIVREHQHLKKTDYYLLAVKHGNTWVLIDSALHSKIVEEAIRLGLIEELQGYTIAKAEAKVGRSRIDFLLKADGKPPLLLEVKGCTLVKNGIALFPDAPTERGRRHLLELASSLRHGCYAMVLFLITRGDAKIFRPYAEVDPKFTEALKQAHECGVMLTAYKAPFNPLGMEIKVEERVPVVIP